jgi:hypothetical protein
MRRDPQLNIYNLAIPGTGTDQHYLLLRDYLERHPDATLEGVLLIFCCNDFRDVLRDEQGNLPKPRFVWEKGALALVNVPIPAHYAKRFTGRYDRAAPSPAPLHLYNLVGMSPRLISADRSERAPAAQYFLVEADPRDRDAAKRGAGLRVALIESSAEADRFRALERFLDAQGIAVAAFPPRRFPQRRLWRDGHLAASGHRELAEVVHGLLERAESG